MSGTGGSSAATRAARDLSISIALFFASLFSFNICTFSASSSRNFFNASLYLSEALYKNFGENRKIPHTQTYETQMKESLTLFHLPTIFLSELRPRTIINKITLRSMQSLRQTGQRVSWN